MTFQMVNFYLALLPWVDEGIVEIIRTPADFDSELNWRAIHLQREKFDKSEELRKAAKVSQEQLSERHKRKMAVRDLILSAPVLHLRKNFQNHKIGDATVSEVVPDSGTTSY